MPLTSAYLEKLNPEQHQARYYALHVAPTLFGDWTLVREWGRIGTAGRIVMDWFDTREQAETALQKIKQRKINKGYLGKG